MTTISNKPRIEVFVEDQGVNGQNNFWRVRLWLRARSRVAVLAQEVFEHEYKRQNWTRYILSVFWPATRRQFLEGMEIDGHAVEVAASVRFYGSSVQASEYGEARALVAANSSYADKGLFIGETADTVAKRLAERRAFAKGWVARNERRLDDWRIALRSVPV